MKASIYTLGCRLNQCESEAFAEAFEQAGFEVSSKPEPCTIHLVNTCTVTSKAEQKARRMIRMYAMQPETEAVVITGCYAQLHRKEIEALSPKAVVVSGLQKSKLLDLPAFLETHAAMGVLESCRLFSSGIEDSSTVQNPFGFDADRFTFHSRAYLKVQDGCDNNCYYCAVHIARGPSVSLAKEEAVKRALELEKAGYHEIVLTGVNLTMYNHDSDGIGGLLDALLCALGKDIRIRFSSLEPDHIDDRFLELIQDKRVQPHFHIPIQSGSDAVLARVNRHYTAADLAAIIAKIRQSRPEAFIACDVIAGLPAEGEKEFEETYSFIKENRFSQLHVFPFSPRPDTMLYKASDRPCEDVRDQRARKLRELSELLHQQYVALQSCKPVEILLENRSGQYWNALTGNYLKVRIKDHDGFERGDLVQAVFPDLCGNEPVITVRERS